MRRDFEWVLDRLFRRRAPEELNLTPAARIELGGRNWPGNLRELGHLLDCAIATAEGPVIDLPDPPARRDGQANQPESELEALLKACGWNMSQVARRLGVNRSTVLRRMRKLGLTVP